MRKLSFTSAHPDSRDTFLVPILPSALVSRAGVQALMLSGQKQE